MTAVRRIAPAIAAIVVLAAAAVVVAGTITTSSARVSARTDVSSFIATGSVALDRVNNSAELFFDADGLYPGADVEGCVEVDYRGSVPADVRLHADRVAGDGLDRFMDLRLDVLPGGCGQPVGSASGPVFSDTLESLFANHGSYENGVGLSDSLATGERIGVHATASLTGGNEAQGLAVDFLMTIEARP